MFLGVMNMALHVLALRLKYFPVEGAFNDCDTIKLENKRMNKGYMGIINISCLFRTYCVGINKALFSYGVFISVKIFRFSTVNAIKPVKI